MKKTIRTILCAAAVVMAAVSCQKSIEPSNPTEEGKGTIDICVNGLMGEYTQVDSTKASLVNNVRVSWEGGETIYVYDGTQCLGSLAASLEGTEDRYALLSTDDTHIVNTPASGTTTLTLVYSPLLTETPTVNAGEISVSLASQTGEMAPFVAYATLDYTGTTITDTVVPFKFATSVIKVNCTGLTASAAITSATLSNVNTACKLTLSGTSAPSISGAVNGAITRTGDSYFATVKVNSEGEAVFQIAVPTLETASEARVLTVEQGLDKAKDKKFTTRSLAAATSVNTVCQLVGLPAGALKGEFSVSATKKVHFSKGNLFWDGDSYEFESAQYLSSWAAENHASLFFWSKDNLIPRGQNYNDPSAAVGDVFFTNDTETTPKSDFTVNGVTGKFRTLSAGEWEYILESRTNAENLYTEDVKVCSVEHCLVIAPDNCINGYPFDKTKKEYTQDEWAAAEAAGLICLPPAGYRNDNSVVPAADSATGSYWTSSSPDDVTKAKDFGFKTIN